MPNFNKSIDAFFAKRIVTQHDSEALKRIRDDFSELEDKHVLDVGGATGSFIKHMSSNHPDKIDTGIDLSAEVIDIAKRRV